MKKIIFLLMILLLTSGCSMLKTYNLDKISINDCVNLAISQNNNLYNVNNIGYRYYLPRSMILAEDRGNIQTIISNKNKFYLNVDLISYYNKTEISRDTSEKAYQFISLTHDNKNGFLEIHNNSDYFFIKMVYNYAIIETQVEERDLKTSVMNMAYILSSIKYNDTIINNKFGEDTLEFNEKTYKIFGPVRETETKNYAYYLEQFDNYTGTIDAINDPDIIGN